MGVNIRTGLGVRPRARDELVTSHIHKLEHYCYFWVLSFISENDCSFVWPSSLKVIVYIFY